jgi:hypothetical protein
LLAKVAALLDNEGSFEMAATEFERLKREVSEHENIHGVVEELR